MTFTKASTMLSDFAKRIRDRFPTGFERIKNRIRLWVTKAHAAFTVGQVFQRTPFAEEERRLIWELGNTEEHCKDCSRLSGVVLTVSEWARLGILPQSPDLACGGWQCDCKLRETSEESVGLSNV